MIEWLRHLARGPILPGMLLSAVFTFVAVRYTPGRDPAPPATVYRTDGIFADSIVENITNRAVGAHATASVHHLRVMERVGAHHHAAHDETVIVLAGNGTVDVGGESHDVEPGLVLVIPRGTVHELTVGDVPVEAISVFSPPFDGEDRVFVD